MENKIKYWWNLSADKTMWNIWQRMLQGLMEYLTNILQRFISDYQNE